jgi:hypothetical protein
VDNYWIRTVANGGTSGFDNGINSAILRYVGAADADPTTNASTSTAALVETDLHPLVPTAVPGTAVAGGADVAMNLAITLDFTTFTFDINGNVRALNFLLLDCFLTYPAVLHPSHGPSTSADPQRGSNGCRSSPRWQCLYPPCKQCDRALDPGRKPRRAASVPLARRMYPF